MDIMAIAKFVLQVGFAGAIAVLAARAYYAQSKKVMDEALERNAKYTERILEQNDKMIEYFGKLNETMAISNERLTKIEDTIEKITAEKEGMNNE